MFKNILIISDNEPLCVQFNKLLIKKSFANVNWDFAISPFSKASKFENKLKRKVKVIDLRKEGVISTIIAKYDLVFSIHCKQIFPVKLVKSVKCINVHPGYNPINRGWYPQIFALIYDLPVGATIHEIDEKLDHGKIICRELVKKEINDTSESLYNKITTKEIELLEKNISKIIHNKYKVLKPEKNGNIFYKSDFNKVRQINLNKKSSALQFINLLRGLSHGNFKNAFFIDPVSGKKVYVAITLEIENE